MPEYIEREAAVRKIAANKKQFDTVSDAEYAEMLLFGVPAADVVDSETYNDLRETFVEFVCSGVHNPAPYCKNRRSTCVDSRGWCTYNDWCEGFNPDGRKGR